MGLAMPPVNVVGNQQGERLLYSLLVGRKQYEGYGERENYGIRIERIEGETQHVIDMSTVNDITTELGTAKELMNRMIEGKVSPIHLTDIVLDYISA